MTPAERTILEQDAAEAAALAAAVPEVDQRIAATCAAFALNLRAIQAVSAQAAATLEANGDAMHFAGLLGALDALVADAGRHSAVLGALGQCRDCQGSA